MDNNYVGRAYGSTTKVTSVEATPMLGYRWSESVSFGAGLRVMQFKSKYTSAIPAMSAPSQWGIIGLLGDGIEEAEEPELRAALGRLADRQRSIEQAAHDIVTGRTE
jgi:long-subunit fatty acid transport protein